MKKRLLLLDNYDSFTYNLFHSLNEVGKKHEIDIFRNDKISVDEALKYNKIVLSPGPGLPKESGILMKLIEANKEKNIPMLGVCLGHQGICEAFGGKLFNHENVFHGIGSEIKILHQHFLFKNLTPPISVGRYHSWSVEKPSLPEEFMVTSEDEHGIIMSVQHKTLNFCGIQFHPESYLCPQGDEILKNWIHQESC